MKTKNQLNKSLNKFWNNNNKKTNKKYKQYNSKGQRNNKNKKIYHYNFFRLNK